MLPLGETNALAALDCLGVWADGASCDEERVLGNGAVAGPELLLFTLPDDPDD